MIAYSTIIRQLLSLIVLLIAGIGYSVETYAADQGRLLASEQITIYGVGVKVEPTEQTVPKNIATIVSAFLQTPTLRPGDSSPIPADAVLKATLRGPSFAEPVEFTISPNSKFDIPPLTVAGVHTLENIRLERDGDVLMYANPESVKIEVIEKLLVTEVTAKALTAEEIKEKGIVFDKDNFQAYNFTAAFAVASGEQIKVNFPVVLPNLATTQSTELEQVDVPALAQPTLPNLSTIIPDTLKMVQTAVPNLSVQGFTLKPITLEGQNFVLPPIPGVIVIPGDIGFLNQYFSVMLMVGNVAPAGSNLVVKDLTADIVLPIGNDKVLNTSDDPLRMANTQTGEASKKQPIVQPGTDGKLGTADDIPQLAPGQSGNAEFLVEGRREGSHTVEMEIAGTLTGLPVGPVAIRGRAAGTVLVRNPTFTMTFTHPDVVNAGEEYTLDVTVTNTSESPANFVKVSLSPQHISGATLVGEQTLSIDSIPSGDSATFTFNLKSKVTGKVFAATLDSDQNIAGQFALKTSVGELGVPLSPDSLVLPKEANSLPKTLRDAAIGMLGKAYAVATAPGSALPKDVKRFSKKMVWDRAVEVAEAGLRVSLHEPVDDSAKQLLMDFMGSNFGRLTEFYPKENERIATENDFSGFDDLRRRSVRGDTIASVVASILANDLSTLGLTAFLKDFSEKVSYRPSHIAVAIKSASGALPFTLSLIDSQGRKLGGIGDKGKITKEIPFSDYLIFKDATNTTAEMAIISVPQGTGYKVRLEKIPGASTNTQFSLSIVSPRTGGGLRQISFENISGQSQPGLNSTASDPYPLTLEMLIDGSSASGQTANPSSDTTLIDPAPFVIGVVQQAEADKVASECGTWRFGRVVAALFSEEVTPESVQDKLEKANITKYALADNQVVGVALQPGRRIAFLALRDPVGPFIERKVTFTDIADRRGNVLTTQTLPIEATITDPAGVVSGKTLQADGTVIQGTEVRLYTQIFTGVECVPSWYGVSTKYTDVEGKYAWDYVLKNTTDRIVAIEPNTEDFRSLLFNIGRDGQRLNVDIVFLGRGTVEGRIFGQDGFTPLKDVALKISSLTDYSQYAATTDSTGRYVVPRVPVGNLLIEAVHVGTNSKVSQAEYMPGAGATVKRDLILINEAVQQVTIKRGKASGYVLESDGATALPEIPVTVYYQHESQPGVKCPGEIPPSECAVAFAKTDVAGKFAFTGIPAGQLRIYAFNQAKLQDGNAKVILSPDGEITGNVLLSGGFGTVKGTVIDADGKPVAGATVGGGVTLTTTNAQGQFTLIDVPVGERAIVAVDQATGTRGGSVINLIAAGEEVNATIVLSAVGTLTGKVLASDGVTALANHEVYLLRNEGGEIRIFAKASTDMNGVYRMEKIQKGEYTLSSFTSDLTDGNIVPVALQFNGQTLVTNIKYMGKGKVTGVIYDDDGKTPLQARVSVSGIRVAAAQGSGVQVGYALQFVQHIKIIDTDISTGKFSFDNIFVGPFVLTAGGPFSPDPITFNGEIKNSGEVVDVKLQLKPTSQIRGTVYSPDGVTPVGKDVIVKFKSNEFRTICSISALGEETCQSIPQGIQEEQVVTGEDGRYWLPIVNPGQFTITVEDPISGKTGQTKGTVAAGQTAEISVRLVGKANVTVNVRGSNTTTIIPNAKVTLVQTEYPFTKRTGIANANGTIDFSGGDAIPEGRFVVLAEDLQNGFAGRASGKVTTDGQNVVVNVYLYNATGVVYGKVYRPNGATVVSNAEISISNNQGALAFTLTDGNGDYRVDNIPLGDFKVEVFEAATGRRGAGSGRIDLANQEVPINIIQTQIGQVKGTVLSSGNLSPLVGWEVRLSQTFASGKSITLNSSTGTDGSFSFPGTSVGTFRLNVFKNAMGNASVEGAVTREGETVDIPMVVNLIKNPEGRIQGIVYDLTGNAKPNIQVTHGQRTVTTDATGAFLFENTPLGRFFLSAESQTTDDKGHASGEILFAGQTVYPTITLSGLGVVKGTAHNADNSAAGLVKVVLQKYPDAGCGSSECTAFADNLGNFQFNSVPAGNFNVYIEHPVSKLKGSTSGNLLPSGIATVKVVLEPTGSITGRTLLKANPIKGVVAELKVNTSSGLRNLYAESDNDGRFTFNAVPTNSYTLSFQDPISGGIAKRSGTVSGNHDLGDIMLDEAPPTVASIDPVPGAIGVPLNQVIKITFSERVNPGTINNTNIVVSKADGAINGILALSDNDTVVTFTPLSPLKDEARYTVRIKGVKDLLDRVMAQEFVSNFSAVDITPPSSAEFSPAQNGGGVPIDSVIRVKYSEPIDPSKFMGVAITLTKDTTPVTGKVETILGNTVVVFTPDRPLDENAQYHVKLLAATDLSGNKQANDIEYNFSTTDRTAPVIASLDASNSGKVIEGGIATVNVNLGSNSDVAFVDFYVNGVLSATDSSAPFLLSLQALSNYGAPGDSIRVGAIATDTSGNRGVATETILLILPDAAPNVSITAPAAGSEVATGAMVTVSVNGTDDVGVTKLGYQAIGGEAPNTATSDISPVNASASKSFTFKVPANAAPDSTITINATAVDTKGQIGKAAAVQLKVLDKTNPVVNFSGLTSGAKVKPGEKVTVVISAEDIGGIASITLKASGAVAFTEARDITPAQNSATTSFTFTVSQGATSTDSVTLEAFAVDKSGNTSATPKVILPVADLTKPTVNVKTETGSLNAVAGRTVKLIADASDDIGVIRIDLETSGALTYTDAKSISPPAGIAQATFNVLVPEGIAEGATITVLVKSVDISGNISSSATLTLTVKAVQDISLPSSLLMLAGDDKEVSMQLSAPAPGGGITVNLASTNAGVVKMPASVTFTEGEITKPFTITGSVGGTTTINALIDNFVRGSMTATVRGGVVSGTVLFNATPVDGVELNVNGITATTAAGGQFILENVSGVDITIKALDPASGRQGFKQGKMSAQNGYLRNVTVDLVNASAINGSVKQADGTTLVGPGVKVTLMDQRSLSDVSKHVTVFTDGQSKYVFPVVGSGSYLIDVSDLNGNRGRKAVDVTQGGETLISDISYLGRGTVTGTLKDGANVSLPNARVDLTSRSIFGGQMSTTTDSQGKFTFGGVFVGEFALSAKDNLTNTAAGTTGNVTVDQQIVTADLQLGPWGTITGKVFRHNGTTTVANATVWSQAGQTITDQFGEFRYDFVPLGTYNINIQDPATKGVGKGVVTLSVHGETKAATINLLGQGTLVVTVKDSNGLDNVADAVVNVVSIDSATGLQNYVNGKTGADGIAILENVLAGEYSVQVGAKGLGGNKTGTLAINAVTPVTVQLQPVASIRGTVYQANGILPQANARVFLLPYNAEVRTGSDGNYAFERLPLGSYGLVVYDPMTNRHRAKASDLSLQTNGQVLIHDLTLIGVGAVTGRVFHQSDSSSASNLMVILSSSNPDFGGTYTDITNAGGFYEFENIPVGAFTLSTGKPDQQLLGEGSGIISADGDIQTIDIPLKSNAVTLPQLLYNGNAFGFQVVSDGSVSSDYLPVFESRFSYPNIQTARGGAGLDLVVNGVSHMFSGGSIATLEDQGRELVVRQDGLGGINVVRKVYVPTEGYFARYLELLTNPTSAPITVDVRVLSDFARSTQYRITHTSSGDGTLAVNDPTTRDFWAIVDDSLDADPFITNVFRSPAAAALVWGASNGAQQNYTGQFTPWEGGLPAYSSLVAGWSQVTIQPGQMVSFMHFVVPQVSRETAKFSAERLTQLPPEALAGLSPTELSAIKNFNVPADGSSTLPALPRLTGVIQGQLLASDGLLIAPDSLVSLKSKNPYFGRTYQFSTYSSSNGFRFESDPTDVNRHQQTIRIPLDEFTLSAHIYAFNVDSPSITGNFASGSSTAVKNIVFSNTGIISGVVKKEDGQPLVNTPVKLQGPNVNRSLNTDQNGAYRFAFVPFGSFEITVGNTGDVLRGEGSVTLNSEANNQTLQITALNNSITLPLTLYDGNIFEYEVQQSGQILNGKNLFFTDTSRGDKGGAYLEINRDGITHTFDAGQFATHEDQKREIVVRQSNIAGLNITRKVFVPREGYFARYLEILNNPTTAPITIDVSVKSDFYPGTIGQNLVLTSSGDALLQTGNASPDYWMTVDDEQDIDPFAQFNSPAGAFVWGSVGAPSQPTVLFTPKVDFQIGPKSETRWNQITIQAGQSVALMHFVVQQASRAAAQASAERLMQLPPEAIAGLNDNERSIISNFVVSANGVSGLPTLPSLTGEISGRLLASDGLTAAESGSVKFNSDHILFSRTYVANINGQTKQYNLKSDVATADNPTVGIPLAGFTLRPFVTSSGIAGSVVTDTFPNNSSVAIRDIIFTNTGMVGGLVSTAAGTPAEGVTVRSNKQGLSTQSKTDGTYKIGFLLPGDDTIYATKSNINGGTILQLGQQAITVAAGQTATANFQMPPLSTLTGTVKSSSGALLSNTSVEILKNGFSRRDLTDQTGRYLLDEIPEGSYQVRAYSPSNSSLFAAANVSFVGEQAQTQDFVLGFSGRVTGKVFYRDGTTPVPSAIIEIHDSLSGAVLLNTPVRTQFTGTYTTGLFLSSNSPMALTASTVFNTSIGSKTISAQESVPAFTASNQLVTRNVILPVNYGNVVAHVFIAGGVTLSSSVHVQARDAANNDLITECHTFTGGECTLQNVYAGTQGVKIVAQFSDQTREQTVNFIQSGAEISVNFTFDAVQGTVTGTVFGGDGATPVPYQTIEVLDAATGGVLTNIRTQENGTYNFTLDPAPAGDIIVRAYFDYGGIEESIIAERRFNLASGSSGINLTLPVAVIKGTVYRNGGVTPVPFPEVFVAQGVDGEIRTTYAQVRKENGEYAVFGVKMGEFTITARDDFAIPGTAKSQIVSISQPVVVNIALVPVGTVKGSVVDNKPGGAAGRTAYLYSDALGEELYPYYMGNTLTYQFDNVPGGGYTVVVQSGDWPFRYSERAAGTITTNGQVNTHNLALGTHVNKISGTVRALDGSVVPSAEIKIEGFTLLRAGAYANSQGVYVYDEGVPPGPVTVKAVNLNAWQSIGQASGTVTNGSDLVLDILLDSLDLGRAHRFFGADGYVYDVSEGAVLQQGGKADFSTGSSYSGNAYRAYIQTAQKPYLYVKGNVGKLEDNGREIVLVPETVNGLQITRKVFVPLAGGYARFLDILYNPSANDETFTYGLDGYMSSDDQTRVSVTPQASGNRYAVTMNAQGWTPSLGHVFSGTGAMLTNTYAEFKDQDPYFWYEWDVPIAAGGKKCFLHFAIQKDPELFSDVHSSAEQLSNLMDPTAFSGLSAEEKACVVNFRVQ